MKSMFALLIVMLSFSAFADCNREAQFIGTVRNVISHSTTEGNAANFTFQVSLGRWFAPSMVCPMWEDEVESAVIKIQGLPSIVDGDEISGVLVFDQETQSYRID
jgi:hypothetical protein